MKTIILILLFITFTKIHANEFNFRKTKWGMTVEEVMKIEDIEKNDSATRFGINGYYCTDYLFDEEFDVSFTFENNKLKEGVYSLNDDSYSTQPKFVLFDKLYKSLTKKYGENNVKNIEFQLYLSDKKETIQKEFCSLECIWELNDTDIILIYIFVKGSGWVLKINYKYINRIEIQEEPEEPLELALGFKGKTGFRNSKWGMKIKEVKNLETLKLTHEFENFLLYDNRLLGMPCDVTYSFWTNRLNNGWYEFQPKITALSIIIDKFIILKERLISLYGFPQEDNSNKIQNFNTEQKIDFSILIYKGIEELKCLWKDDDYEIKLTLSSDIHSDFDLILWFSPNKQLNEQFLEEDSKSKL